jgi:hypothetical protein
MIRLPQSQPEKAGVAGFILLVLQRVKRKTKSLEGNFGLGIGLYNRQDPAGESVTMFR